MIALIFQGIPEQIAVATLAFVISGIPLKWKKIILIGISLAFISYGVRLFPIPFGTHTLLLIIVLFLALTLLSKGDLSLSLIASLISFLLLVIFELVGVSLLMRIMGMTPETLFASTLRRTMVGESNVLLMFLAAFLLNKFMKKRVSQ